MKQSIEDHKKQLEGIKTYLIYEADQISRLHYPSSNTEKDDIIYRKARLNRDRSDYEYYKFQFDRAVAKGLESFERKTQEG